MKVAWFLDDSLRAAFLRVAAPALEQRAAVIAVAALHCCESTRRGRINEKHSVGAAAAPALQYSCSCTPVMYCVSGDVLLPSDVPTGNARGARTAHLTPHTNVHRHRPGLDPHVPKTQHRRVLWAVCVYCWFPAG